MTDEPAVVLNSYNRNTRLVFYFYEIVEPQDKKITLLGSFRQKTKRGRRSECNPARSIGETRTGRPASVSLGNWGANRDETETSASYKRNRDVRRGLGTLTGKVTRYLQTRQGSSGRLTIDRHTDTRTMMPRL